MPAALKIGVRCRSFQSAAELGVVLETAKLGIGTTVKLLKEDGPEEEYGVQSAWWSAHGYEELLQGDASAADAMKLVSQEEIHLDLASRLLFAMMDGEPIVLMAVGVAGSGKTYTLFGPDSKGQNGIKPWFDYQQPHVTWGLFPRLAHDIFSQAKSKGAQWICSVKYMQACGNTVCDLIQNNTNFWSTGLETAEDGDPFFDWIPPTHVATFSDLCNILRDASANIRTGKTEFSDNSSPGHTILELEVERPHPKENGLKLRCKLLVCDLVGLEYRESSAGSVKPESAVGQLAEAGASIKGLSNVFQKMSGSDEAGSGSALSETGNHFLEKFLAPSVAQARTFLLGMLSPERHLLPQASNVLKFLSSASGVKTRAVRVTRASMLGVRQNSRGSLGEGIFGSTSHWGQVRGAVNTAAVFKKTSEEMELSGQMEALRAQVEELGKEREKLQSSLQEERKKSTVGVVVNGVQRRASELARMLNGMTLGSFAEGDEDTDSEKEDAIDEDEVVDEAVLGKQMRFMEVDEEISAATAQVQEVESEFNELVAGAHQRLRSRSVSRLQHHENERQKFVGMNFIDMLVNKGRDVGAVHIWGVDSEFSWGRYCLQLTDKTTLIGGPTGKMIIEGEDSCWVNMEIANTGEAEESEGSKRLKVSLSLEGGAVYLNGAALENGTTMDIFDGDIVVVGKEMLIFSAPEEKSGSQVELDSATLEKAYNSIFNPELNSPAPSPSLLPSPKKRGRARRPSVLAEDFGMWASMAADAVEARRQEDEEIKKVIDSKRTVWEFLADAFVPRGKGEEEAEMSRIRDSMRFNNAWKQLFAADADADDNDE